MQNLRQVLDFAFVGTLARDSSNIIDLIQRTYNVIKIYHCFFGYVLVCEVKF